MKRSLICLVSMVICLCTLMSCRQNPPKLLVWNTYEGQIEQYKVTIEVSKNEGDATWQRRVELQPLPNSEIWKGQADSIAHITGFDYNADGVWDRIFYCGYPESAYGCNSVALDANGKMTDWEPCSADEGRLSPFTPKEIKDATDLLTIGLNTIQTIEHRTSTLKEWRQRNGYPEIP